MQGLPVRLKAAVRLDLSCPLDEIQAFSDVADRESPRELLRAHVVLRFKVVQALASPF